MDSRHLNFWEREHPENAYLVNGTLPEELIVHIGSYLQKTGDQTSLVQACVRFHSIFQPSLNEFAFEKLSQAVIDDDRKTVEKLLDKNPNLLLLTPSKALMIESKLTWQKFYVEDVLTMAVKRKQIKMILLLLSYYDRLEQTDIVKKQREAALSFWSYKMQKNANDENEIIIPQEYVDYAQSLIDVFKVEAFPHEKLSEQTEKALVSLFNKLLPESAVKLDNYLDVELLLLAVYKAYRNNFDAFQNWNQSDAFCVRVIGLIQSVQSPEIAKIFCEGLDEVVIALKEEKEKEISKQAAEHKLKDGKAFYRPSRDSNFGLGFEFLCGRGGLGWRGQRGVALLEKLCQAKIASFWKITQQQQPILFLAKHKESGCVIL